MCVSGLLSAASTSTSMSSDSGPEIREFMDDLMCANSDLVSCIDTPVPRGMASTEPDAGAASGEEAPPPPRIGGQRSRRGAVMWSPPGKGLSCLQRTSEARYFSTVRLRAWVSTRITG
jgi:hypothetical protein